MTFRPCSLHSDRACVTASPPLFLSFAQLYPNVKSERKGREWMKDGLGDGLGDGREGVDER